MAQLIKKENITIVIEKYTDQQGNEKSKYRTIGELITMCGDDGNEYSFGNIWGPHGVTKFNIYPQDDKNQNTQGAQQQQQGQGFNQNQQSYNQQNQSNFGQNQQQPTNNGYNQR